MMTRLRARRANRRKPGALDSRGQGGTRAAFARSGDSRGYGSAFRISIGRGPCLDATKGAA